MLNCFCKYLYVNKLKSIININYNYKNKKTKIDNTYSYRNVILTINSLFFRKAHFRSLITYINVLYSNLDSSNSDNFFYFSKYIVSNNVFVHPGFLFKKYHLK